MSNVRHLIIKVVLAQKERDEAINHLVEVMNSVYSFIQEAETLSYIESHRQIVAVIAQQTTDCAYFIRDYTINKNFCTPVIVYGSPKAESCI